MSSRFFTYSIYLSTNHKESEIRFDYTNYLTSSIARGVMAKAFADYVNTHPVNLQYDLYTVLYSTPDTYVNDYVYVESNKPGTLFYYKAYWPEYTIAASYPGPVYLYSNYRKLYRILFEITQYAQNKINNSITGGLLLEDSDIE